MSHLQFCTYKLRCRHGIHLARVIRKDMSHLQFCRYKPRGVACQQQTMGSVLTPSAEDSVSQREHIKYFNSLADSPKNHIEVLNRPELMPQTILAWSIGQVWTDTDRYNTYTQISICTKCNILKRASSANHPWYIFSDGQLGISWLSALPGKLSRRDNLLFVRPTVRVRQLLPSPSFSHNACLAQANNWVDFL